MQGLLIIDSDNTALLIEYLDACAPRLKSHPVTVVILDSAPGMRNFIRRDFEKWSAHVLFADFTTSLVNTVELLALKLPEYRVMLFSQHDSKIEEAKQLSWDNLYLPRQGELYQAHLDDFTRKCDAKIVETAGQKPTFVLALDIDDTTVFLQRSLRSRTIVLNPYLFSFIRHFFEKYHAKATISVVFITARNAETEENYEQREKNAKTPKELAEIRSRFLSVKRILAAFLAELAGLLLPDQITVHFNEDKFLQLSALCGPDTVGVMLDDNRVWLAPFEHAPAAVREKINFISVHAEINHLLGLDEQINTPVSCFEHQRVIAWCHAVVTPVVSDSIHSVAHNTSAFLPVQNAGRRQKRAFMAAPDELYQQKEKQGCGCVVS